MKSIINFGLKIIRSEFVKNTSKLMTGSVFSQALPIIAAPILSRIYLPESYGVLGLYMSTTGIISMLTTLQYSNAIVIAKNDTEAFEVIRLCLKLLIGFTIISLFFIALYHKHISEYLHSPNLSIWLWVAPGSIFLNGLSTIFGNYAIRNKLYGLVSSNRVISSVSSTICSLAVGYLFQSELGLFTGLWIGQFINGVLLSCLVLKKSGIKFQEFWQTNASNFQIARTYIDFPKYSLPADFINNFTNQIPLLMLNTYESVSAVGNYNMSNRILGLPSMFISSALGDVFRQRAAQDFNTSGNCESLFKKTLLLLSITAFIPFVIIIIFGPQFFTFVLGEKWHSAGEFAQMLGLLFLIRFIVSPLTYVYYIGNKLKEDFWLHLLFPIVSFISFYYGFVIKKSLSESLIIYSTLNSSIYVLYLIRSFKISKGHS